MKDWRSEAGIRGGRLFRQRMVEGEKIARATPLAVQDRPQRRQDAPQSRHDGLQRVSPPKPEAKPLPERECKRAACKRWFTPKRIDQVYCDMPKGHCRKLAHFERHEEPLLAVLQDLVARPARLRETITAQKLALTDLLDPMQKFAFTTYTDFCELARKAEMVLEQRKKKSAPDR